MLGAAHSLGNLGLRIALVDTQAGPGGALAGRQAGPCYFAGKLPAGSTDTDKHSESGRIFALKTVGGGVLVFYALAAQQEPILGTLREIDPGGGPRPLHDFEADLPGGGIAAIEWPLSRLYARGAQARPVIHAGSS